MTKEEIMNTYAIEQGYESWEHLIISTIQYYGYKDATNHITTLFNAVTDLIQEELKKKVNVIALDNLELFNSEYEILSNVILKTEIL